MTSSPRCLVVVRHAKSDQDAGVADHERPLSERGRRDAPALGRWLAEQLPAPDHVLCSSALRARQTWQLAAAELRAAPEPQVSTSLYLASPGRLLEAVRAVPADVAVLVVVGHEPTQSTLASALAGPGGDPTATRAMAAGFTTCAVAVLDVDDPWESLAPHGARLVRFAAPRAPVSRDR